MNSCLPSSYLNLTPYITSGGRLEAGWKKDNNNYTIRYGTVRYDGGVRQWRTAVAAIVDSVSTLVSGWNDVLTQGSDMSHMTPGKEPYFIHSSAPHCTELNRIYK